MRRLAIFSASLLTCAVTVMGNSGLAGALPAARSYTETANGNVYLGGEYIELGVSRLGSFGTTTSVPLPSGFFGTASRTAIGMSTNPAGFGETPDLRMDFFMPGSPEERWTIGYKQDGTTTTASNAMLRGTQGISNNVVTDQSSGDTLQAQSIGTHNSKLEVKQIISFNKSDKFFKNEVTLKNVDSASMDSVRYMRTFDPDNTVDKGGDYTTRNVVTHTIAAGDGKAVVVADANIPDATDPVFAVNGSHSPIFFYSSDSRARVSTFGFANTNPYAAAAYDTPTAKGTEVIEDQAITITFDVGTLAAGASETFSYYTSLDNRDIDEILEDIATDEGGPVEEPEDQDNVSAEVEDAAPNNGDANGDNVPDSTQSNVSSVHNTVVGGSAYVSLEVSGDCNTVTELELKPEASVANDGAYTYPLGLADFASSCTTPGGSSTVKLYFDKEYDTSKWVIRKYLDGAFSNVPGAVLGTANVGSTKVTTLTYTVTDGGPLDDDGTVNGTIVDPAGPAVLAVTAPDTGIAPASALAVFAPLAAGSGLLVAGLQKRRSARDADLS